MKEEFIRRLVKIVEESDIAELEISRWGRKLKISKYPSNHAPAGATQHYFVPGSAPAPPAVSNSNAASAPASAAEAPEPSAPETPAKGEEIRSPMVGTFYRAPAPDADPYVQVGDTVQKGQVLCIIEAMKLMNEIEAEFPCRILEILVENAQPVEYNQPLFRVEKL